MTDPNCSGAPTRELYDLARRSRWEEFIERSKSHPADAKWRFTWQLDGRKYSSFPADTYTVLHYLVLIKDEAPVQVYEAVANAFPAAITIQTPKHKRMPLHDVASRCSCQHWLLIFKLLLNTSRKSTIGTLESILPLPSEVLREHILPFLDNPLLSKETEYGNTVLHELFRNPRGHARIEAIQMMLSMASELAAITNNRMDTPLHLAVSRPAPFAHLSMLVQCNPDALLMKDNCSTTPLLLYLRVTSWNRTTRFNVLKLLAETRPRAVVIPNAEFTLPLTILQSPNTPEYRLLCKLTKRELCLIKRLNTQQRCL